MVNIFISNRFHPSLSSGDIALTQEAFIAVAGELGNGQTNVEWHFI